MKNSIVWAEDFRFLPSVRLWPDFGELIAFEQNLFQIRADNVRMRRQFETGFVCHMQCVKELLFDRIRQTCTITTTDIPYKPNEIEKRCYERMMAEIEAEADEPVIKEAAK